ncbi:LysE family translocator [Ponticoccus gilvus]|nr:LysE family translocator [Enemella evansiae]
MTQDLFLALALFCFVTVASPGPNNLMLMASGANFGFRRTLPHLAGVVWGLPVMILPVGLGVMQVFTLWPWTQDVLSILCLAYLLWLAWKIAHAAPPARAEATARPLSLWQAAGFQWVNPKAWTMALGAITLYAAARDLPSILWVAGTYAGIGTLTCSAWVLMGTGIRRLLARPERLRWFNRAMAVLLVASVLPMMR